MEERIKRVCIAFVVSFVHVSPLMTPLSISRPWSKVSGKDFSLVLLILYWYYSIFIFYIYYSHLPCQSCPCCITSGRSLHFCAFSWPFPRDSLSDLSTQCVCSDIKWQILTCRCLTWSLGLQKQHNYILRTSHLILACMHLKEVGSFILWQCFFRSVNKILWYDAQMLHLIL